MSDFSKAIATVIATHEGGFQNRADDPGNYDAAGNLKGTKYGISAHSFPNVDIENLTLQGAEDLYRQTYGMFAELEDQRVLTKVLDLAVNMQWGGHGAATRILQRAINCIGFTGLTVDGDLGPATVSAANACNPDQLLGTICDEAASHYANIEANKPDMQVWFKNWNARAAWLPPEEA